MPIQESEARLPGWTLLRNPNGGSTRYRAPDGSEVGKFAYTSALKMYEKTGIPPQTPLGSKWKNRKENKLPYSSDEPSSDRIGINIDVPDTDDTLFLPMPDARPTPASRSRSGAFTARELSDGLNAILVILTSLLAVATSLPEAQMTETEVKAVSIPLGNIFERSKYNKTIGSIIVGKGDYLTLGYALYIYLDRVKNAAVEKRYANAQSSRNAQQAQNFGPAVGSANGASAGPGVPLRTAPSGLRGYTGVN